MPKNKSYNTKARKVILDYLENASKTVSALEIIEFLNANDISINQTTVYRYLNRLLEEGKVIKVIDNSSQKALYQLSRDKTCEGHIHIQCVSCGRLEHLDCDFMEELHEHIEKSHNFDLLCEGSILLGKCSECNQK